MRIRESPRKFDESAEKIQDIWKSIVKSMTAPGVPRAFIEQNKEIIITRDL